MEQKRNKSSTQEAIIGNNISNLIHEREMINSRIERMIYGLIEIRKKATIDIYMFIEGLMV